MAHVLKEFILNAVNVKYVLAMKVWQLAQKCLPLTQIIAEKRMENVFNINYR